MKNELNSGADIMIAVLAAGDPGTIFSPVQIQKILYVLGREADMGQDIFKFEANNYGPFDHGIYDVLDELKNDECLVEIKNGIFSEYVVNPKGFKIGKKKLKILPKDVAKYVKKLVKWTVKCSFSELISAIYNRYPETKNNSVF